MRLVVEAKTQEDVEEIRKLAAGNKNIEIVDQYDVRIKITEGVENIRVLLKEIEGKGISRNVLLYYLKGKGHAISDVNHLLDDCDKFLEQIGIR